MFLRPGTLDEALAALADTHATVLSGGTDLFPALSFGPLRGAVLDISALTELKGIGVTESHIEIGGRTTWSEIVSANLPRGFDGLKAAAREIGAVQIQNQATVAGNICNASPAADGIAALMALAAEVTLVSHSAARTLPLGESAGAAPIGPGGTTSGTMLVWPTPAATSAGVSSATICVETTSSRLGQDQWKFSTLIPYRLLRRIPPAPWQRRDTTPGA